MNKITNFIIWGCEVLYHFRVKTYTYRFVFAGPDTGRCSIWTFFWINEADNGEEKLLRFKTIQYFSSWELTHHKKIGNCMDEPHCSDTSKKQQSLFQEIPQAIRHIIKRMWPKFIDTCREIYTVKNQLQLFNKVQCMLLKMHHGKCSERKSCDVIDFSPTVTKLCVRNCNKLPLFARKAAVVAFQSYHALCNQFFFIKHLLCHKINAFNNIEIFPVAISLSNYNINQGNGGAKGYTVYVAQEIDYKSHIQFPSDQAVIELGNAKPTLNVM